MPRDFPSKPAFNTQANPPAGFNGASTYNFCALGAAVANNQYVVFLLMPDLSTTQLAVYAINSDGTLSTTDTAATITTVAGGVAAPTYAFDPTGTWLAVGSNVGLYLYQFTNGQLTLTDSLPIPDGPPGQLLWDNNGYIYWFGQSCCGSFLAFSASSNGTLTELPQTAPYGPVGSNDTWFLDVQPLQ